MREYAEEDPKKPVPVRSHPHKKGLNVYEQAEAAPWRRALKDVDRDRHRHV